MSSTFLRTAKRRRSAWRSTVVLSTSRLPAIIVGPHPSKEAVDCNRPIAPGTKRQVLCPPGTTFTSGSLFFSCSALPARRAATRWMIRGLPRSSSSSNRPGDAARSAGPGCLDEPCSQKAPSTVAATRQLPVCHVAGPPIHRALFVRAIVRDGAPRSLPLRRDTFPATELTCWLRRRTCY